MLSFILVGYYPTYEDEYLIAFLIASFCSVWFYYDNIYTPQKQLKQSLDWLSVEGNIVSKKVISHLFILDRMSGFFPSIKYRYELDGELYLSEQFTLLPRYSFMRKKDDALKLMYKVAKKKKITVYVNPNNYNESYIYKEGYHDRFILLFWGLIVFPLFGIPLYFYFTS